MITPEELREIERRERRLLDPAVRVSGDQLDELLHPEFFEFGVSGRTWDRESIIAALVENPEVTGVAAEFRTRPLTANVALLTYRIDGPTPSLRASTWVREPPGDWQLRFHQGTPL